MVLEHSQVITGRLTLKNIGRSNVCTLFVIVHIIKYKIYDQICNAVISIVRWVKSLYMQPSCVKLILHIYIQAERNLFFAGTVSKYRYAYIFDGQYLKI